MTWEPGVAANPEKSDSLHYEQHLHSAHILASLLLKKLRHRSVRGMRGAVSWPIRWTEGLMPWHAVLDLAADHGH